MKANAPPAFFKATPALEWPSALAKYDAATRIPLSNSASMCPSGNRADLQRQRSEEKEEVPYRPHCRASASDSMASLRRLTQDKEAKRVIILRCVGSVGCCNTEERRDDGTESAVEKAKSREDRVCVSVTQYQLPLRRYDHADALRKISAHGQKTCREYVISDLRQKRNSQCKRW
ncbi:MAG: hypothetical protein Q9203_005861 [Teloschistes exilis]